MRYCRGAGILPLTIDSEIVPSKQTSEYRRLNVEKISQE